MFLITYYKFGNRWFLDNPDYIEKGGDPDDLERVGAFNEMLDLVAEGETSVTFQLGFQPFDVAESAELTGTSGDNTGAYYAIKTLGAKTVDIELWLNTSLYYKDSELPTHLYFKKVASTQP